MKSTIQAFTLIELLVGVLIMSILVAVAVPQYQKAVAKARAVEILLSSRDARQALDRWILENGWPAGEPIDPTYFTGKNANAALDIDLGSPDNAFDNCGEELCYYIVGDSESVLVSITRGNDPAFDITKYKDGSVELNCLYDNPIGKDICNALNDSHEHNVRVQHF